MQRSPLLVLPLLLACYSLAAPAAEDNAWERQKQLQKENLQEVKVLLQKKSQALLQFFVDDKRPINDNYSVMVVSGFDNNQPHPIESWLGVFIVFGKANQVYMTLDVSSQKTGICSPEVHSAQDTAIYLQWFTDDGSYCGTYKYTYDLMNRQNGRRYGYSEFSVKKALTRDGGVSFTGSYEAPRETPVEHDPAGDIVLSRRAAEPEWSVRVSKPPAEGNASQQERETAVPESVMNALPRLPGGSQPGHDRLIQAKHGLWLYIPIAETPWGRQQSGVYLVNSEHKVKFYPVPLPTMGLYKQLRLKTGAVAQLPGTPGELENHIGPFALDGERLWFANEFYDGEGVSGVGAIGSFDITTLQYEMRYLPEIAPWSGSALLVDQDSVWVGLMQQPEGTAYGSGVLQFNKRTRLVRTYPIKDYVSTMTLLGSELYFGTRNGVYTFDQGAQKLSQIRVEPGPGGPYQVVTQPIAIN
jgi:hypothetical protein